MSVIPLLITILFRFVVIAPEYRKLYLLEGSLFVQKDLPKGIINQNIIQTVENKQNTIRNTITGLLIIYYIMFTLSVYYAFTY